MNRHPHVNTAKSKILTLSTFLMGFCALLTLVFCSCQGPCGIRSQVSCQVSAPCPTKVSCQPVSPCSNPQCQSCQTQNPCQSRISCPAAGPCQTKVPCHGIPAPCRPRITPACGLTPVSKAACAAPSALPCRNPACPTCSVHSGNVSSCTPIHVSNPSLTKEPHWNDPQIPAQTSEPTPAPDVVPSDNEIPVSPEAPAVEEEFTEENAIPEDSSPLPVEEISPEINKNETAPEILEAEEISPEPAPAPSQEKDTAPEKNQEDEPLEELPAVDELAIPEEISAPKQVEDTIEEMMAPLVPTESGVRVLEAPGASELDLQPEITPKENLPQPQQKKPALPEQAPKTRKKPAKAEEDPSELPELPTLEENEENEEDSSLPNELLLPESLESSDISGATGEQAGKPVRHQSPLKKALKPQASASTPSSVLFMDKPYGLHKKFLETGKHFTVNEGPMNITVETILRSTNFSELSSRQSENSPSLRTVSDSKVHFAADCVNASEKAFNSVSSANDISFAVVTLPFTQSAQENPIRLTAAEEPAAVPTPAPAMMDLEAIEKRLSAPERPSFAQPADKYIIDTKKSAQKIDIPNPQKIKVGGQEMDDNWQTQIGEQTGTFIYFNNGQGRATIQSPDPVYIYAPRFRAVRQVVDLNIDEQVLSTGDLYTPTEVSIQGQNLETSTTKQNIQTRTEMGKDVMIQAQTSAGTGQMDGITAPQIQAQEAVIAQENRSVIGPNVSEGKTRAWSADGTIFVNAWTANEELRVFIEKESASVSVQNMGIPSLYTVKEGTHKQNIRIAKVASTTSAKPGETIDFIIYFENTGKTPVGNITLVDNLPARLEIVEDSAESSVDSSFTYEINGSGSQTLRWEITQPLYAGEKGAVKFKALVR